MADRAIVARLRAEASQFIQTMGRSAKATEQVGEAAEKSSRKADGAFKRMASQVRANSEHIDRLGNTALIAGGAITAGLGFGIKAFADFDEAMSSVNAALPQAGAQMDALRQIAIDLGKDTQFSATEAAQGITELGKAGLDADQILSGGLAGSLDLAAAGQLEVARAAEVSATALKQFNLEGSELGKVADLYAAAAGKAQGSVEDIAQAMKFAGVTANGLDVSIEETVGTLGLFAEAGIIGEQAGTSLRSVLLSLTSPSKIAADTMADLGIAMYDAQGNFVGIGGAADQLRAKLGPLDEATRNAALGQIFGNESINAARLLYEGGSEAVQEWTASVDDAGFASRQAAALTDNLKGDIERLGGALDAVFVQNGEGVNGALRGLVQSIEGTVEGFGELPPQVQQGALALAGITGGGLLAAGALAKLVTTGADVIESMEALRVKAPRAAKGIDLATRAARSATIAFASLAAASILLGDESEIPIQATTKELLNAADAAAVFDKAIADLDLGDQLGSLEGVLETALDPNVFEKAQSKANGFLKAISGGIIDLGNPLDLANEQLASLDAVLTSLASSGNAAEADRILRSIAAARPGTAVEDLTALLPGYEEALAGADVQQKLAADSSQEMSDGLTDIERAAEDAKADVESLADEIRNFGAAALDADDAEAKFRDAVDDVTETVKENAQAVKDGEMTKAQATRDNEGALRDLAQATLDNSAATLEFTGSADEARAKMQTGREEFIKAATQMGLNATEAEALADKYGLIPASVTTEIQANGASTARKSVQELIDTIARLNSKTVTVGVRYVYSGTRPNGGRSTVGGLTIDADGGMHVRSAAGMVKAYADGGTWDGTLGGAQPRIAPAGGRGILWAEEGAGPWEAFISGHPGKRARSRLIASDTVERLGGRVEWQRFADGGMFGRNDVVGASTYSESTDASVHIHGGQFGPTLEDIERAASARRRRDAFSPSKRGG